MELPNCLDFFFLPLQKEYLAIQYFIYISDFPEPGKAVRDQLKADIDSEDE